MTIRNRSTSSFATRASDGESPAVLTLVKALDVMEAVAGSSGMTVAEIAAKVGLNRTTAHRLVQTLKNLHYLQPAASGRGFEIGLKLLPLAAQQLDSNKVRLAALPHLNTLAQQAGERVESWRIVRQRAAVSRRSRKAVASQHVFALWQARPHPLLVARQGDCRLLSTGGNAASSGARTAAPTDREHHCRG